MLIPLFSRDDAIGKALALPPSRQSNSGPTPRSRIPSFSTSSADRGVAIPIAPPSLLVGTRDELTRTLFMFVRFQFQRRSAYTPMRRRRCGSRAGSGLTNHAAKTTLHRLVNSLPTRIDAQARSPHQDRGWITRVEGAVLLSVCDRAGLSSGRSAAEAPHRAGGICNRACRTLGFFQVR